MLAMLHRIWKFAEFFLDRTKTYIYYVNARLRGITRHSNLLVLGLDNSGKSTLLRSLKTEFGGQPNIFGSTFNQVDFGNIRFQIFEFGGMAQPPLDNHLPSANGVIFLVDTADPERFQEANEKLHKLLAMEQLRMVSFLILGNKIDHPDAVHEGELRRQLGLDLITGRDRPIELLVSSAVWRVGHKDAMTWLSQNI